MKRTTAIEYDGTKYTAKLCPYCGSEPRIRTVEHCFYVECANAECGVENRKAFASPHTALFAWNRRFTHGEVFNAAQFDADLAESDY